MQPIDLIKSVYKTLPERVTTARKLAGHPLTLTEKILMTHLRPQQGQELARKKSTVALAPDRVAMQDATAQMALLQFMSSGIPTVQVPSTVHCDHLIRAHTGAAADLDVANSENKEVYDFLQSVSQKYGIGFWKPGAGIIHQVVLENYAFPGGMMIGTDSHTPNAGGLGMLAIGVGGADAVDVMVGEPFGLKYPGIIGIKLTGQLNGWTSAKDVILKVMSILTVKGGTGHIVEYFGEGTASISCTGKATICNMGAEHGATTSVFPFDDKMAAYLGATNRKEWAELANGVKDCLTADPDVLKDPAKYFDQVIEIDLNTLEPYVVGPHTPDLARPISAFAAEIKKEGWPETLSSALIGSCTNSSYEDIGRSVSVLRDALSQGAHIKTPLLITPGSEQVFATIKRDGYMDTFDKVGATVLANACGPCIGQWQRDDIKKGDVNAIISSYNRNFRARNDANNETLSFIASPELVAAQALAGKITFNPLKDKLKTDDGKEILLKAPVGDELPQKGFVADLEGFIPPATNSQAINILISPESKRLQMLTPFKAWDGKDALDLPILLKAKGKCTTDHISAAGPWLKFRGHLDNISDNMFIGATNAFTGEIGKGKNTLSGKTGEAYPAIARAYKAKDLGWVVIGDENYGEGSSREHAAMSPRHLGARAIIVKSFARIHETNLKKQGVLPLILASPADYDKFLEDDRISIFGLTTLAPDKPLTVSIKHSDGKTESITVNQTLTAEQIEWFKAGSALNKIANDLAKNSRA
jgi:aconitate hydratase